MMLDDSDSHYQWWTILQQLDMTKVGHLIDIHPHLVWTRMIDPVFQPVGYNAFLENFGDDLGSCLDDLSSLHWLLFYYRSHIDVKTLVLDLLNEISMEDLAINEGWGNQKNTLLHLVSALGYDDLARVLLEKGVTADVPNTLGRLPHHVARTDSMVDLLDTNHRSKASSKTSDGDLDSFPSGMTQSNSISSNQPHQLQQQSAQHSSSTNIDRSVSGTEATTIKKPNKDGHYFRAGHVEETKQKVLTDEQVELQKQRERRRKDIAQLAKRSAVKNNPFVKKSEPSLAQTSSRHGLMASSSTGSSDNTATNDTNTNTSSSNTTIHDRKHKRNSKVINSLQTKSYVSSSIFRQGEPTGGNSLRQYLVHSQDKHRELDPTHAAEPSDNHTLEPLPGSRPASSTTLEIPPTTRNKINGTKDSDLSSDGNDRGKHSRATNMTKDLQQDGSSASTETEYTNEGSAIPENAPSPSVSSASLASVSTSISTSISVSSSVYEDPLMDEHISTNLDTSANAEVIPSTINTPMTPIPSANAPNDLSARTKNISNKRQSGSQKTHWSKELASWESVLNREFDLEKVGNQAIGNTTLATTELDSAMANASLKSGKDTGVLDDVESGKDLNSGSLPFDHRVTNSKQTLEDRQQQRQRYNKNEMDEDNRHQGGNGTMFESSRLPLKSYGSVSVKSMATYTRRLPTFDTSAEMIKNNDNSPNILSQLDNTLNTGTDGLTTTTTSRSSDHRRHHLNHSEKEMTRSASVSNASSQQTTGNYYPQTKNGSLTIPAYLAPNTKSTTTDNSSINSGRGKLYIRVHGVHDILLPLPRDRAHVKCVIGDGRYEYMSRYEILGQDMTFGYECIIDSHPGMIVTLSLHVRPDYMLKKPLTRLFSTNRKRKGSLSAYVSSEDGAVGQTRFAVGDMLSACHRRSYSANFHCFNAWYIHSREKSSSSLSSSSVLSSSSSRQQEQDGVLKVIGNFDVELLYLPVSDPSLPVPKNLRECDMAIKMQHWNETRFDTDYYPKIQRPPPRLAQEKSLWSVEQ